MSSTPSIRKRPANKGLRIANLLLIANGMVFGWVGYEMFQYGKVSASLHQLADREHAAPGTIDFRTEPPEPSVAIHPDARKWLSNDIVELPDVALQLGEAPKLGEHDWQGVVELVSDRSLPTAFRTAWLRHLIASPPVHVENSQELIQMFDNLSPDRSGLPASNVADLASHWMMVDNGIHPVQSQVLRQIIRRLDPNRRLGPAMQPKLRRGIDFDTSPTLVKQAAAFNANTVAKAIASNRSRQPGRGVSPEQLAERWLGTLRQPEGYGRFVADIQTAGTDDPAVKSLIGAAHEELTRFKTQSDRSLTKLPEWVDRVAIACGDIKLFASLRQAVAQSDPIGDAQSVDRWIGVALAHGDPRWAKTLMQALPDSVIPPRWQNHQVALQTDPWWADLAATIDFLAGDDQAFVIERLTDETAAGRVARQIAIDEPSWSPEFIQAVASGLASADPGRPDRWEWLGHAWPDPETRQQLAESIPEDLDWSLWSMIAPILPPQEMPSARWKQAAERGMLPMLLMPLLIDTTPVAWATIDERLGSLPAGSVFAEGNDRLDWAVALRILRFVAAKEKLPPDFDKVAVRCGSTRTQAVLERLTKLPDSTLSVDDAKRLVQQINRRGESRKTELK